MKILFVLENYYPKIGGVETLFKHLTEALAIEGHEVTVVTNGGGKSSFKNFEGNGSLNIKRLKLFNRYIFTLLAFFPILYYIKGQNLIHTTSYNAALPAYLAAKLTRKKVIITFHEVWGKLWFDLPFISSLSSYLHYSFEQMILKFNFDRFIAVSEFTRDRLLGQGVPKSRIMTIYNGITYENFESVIRTKVNSKFTICYFGRLGISKGLDILLRSIKELERGDFEFKIVIPKEPQPLFRKIIGLIKEYEIAERIELFHNLDSESLRQLIKNSDATVIPSYSEGFCFAAVESIALGVPLITSKKGALIEVVTGNHIHLTGLSKEALVSAFLQAQKGHWQFLPKKKFELNEKIVQYLQLYKDLNLRV